VFSFSTFNIFTFNNSPITTGRVIIQSPNFTNLPRQISKIDKPGDYRPRLRYCRVVSLGARMIECQVCQRSNAGEVLFPDQPKLREQLLSVVLRNGRLERKDGMSFIASAAAIAANTAFMPRASRTSAKAFSHVAIFVVRSCTISPIRCEGLPIAAGHGIR
jgi:hypothetical protein